ncbi:MAG TPA: fatty acid desaturase [Phycisphaerae bacterium]|nr:fatty acid desaturase [Phycisphaerae bacterium]
MGVAIFLLWGRGFSWLQLSLLLTMYCVTGMGITLGFHRLLTHRSFETHRITRLALSILGSMAVQGPILKWVATHRRHHQHSDHEEDPHSPHQHGDGILGIFRGLWHSHLGWLFKPDAPNLDRYVGDLMQDNLIKTASALFPLWVFIGLLIPTVIGGVLTRSWIGALTGLIWGGLVRIFLVHHVTWSVNSICHIWGSRPFRCGDHSRNNFLFGVLAWGEGWHNNHHAFPTSARHGLRWWQFDCSYLAILLLSALGLAWNVRVPSPQTVRLKSSANLSTSVAAAAC